MVIKKPAQARHFTYTAVSPWAAASPARPGMTAPPRTALMIRAGFLRDFCRSLRFMSVVRSFSPCGGLAEGECAAHAAPRPRSAPRRRLDGERLCPGESARAAVLAGELRLQLLRLERAPLASRVGDEACQLDRPAPRCAHPQHHGVPQQLARARSRLRGGCGWAAPHARAEDGGAQPMGPSRDSTRAGRGKPRTIASAACPAAAGVGRCQGCCRARTWRSSQSAAACAPRGSQLDAEGDGQRQPHFVVAISMSVMPNDQMSAL